jgi:hypothetical protein
MSDPSRLAEEDASSDDDTVKHLPPPAFEKPAAFADSGSRNGSKRFDADADRSRASRPVEDSRRFAGSVVGVPVSEPWGQPSSSALRPGEEEAPRGPPRALIALAFSFLLLLRMREESNSTNACRLSLSAHPQAAAVGVMAGTIPLPLALGGRGGRRLDQRFHGGTGGRCSAPTLRDYTSPAYDGANAGMHLSLDGATKVATPLQGGALFSKQGRGADPPASAAQGQLGATNATPHMKPWSAVELTEFCHKFDVPGVDGRALGAEAMGKCPYKHYTSAVVAWQYMKCDANQAASSAFCANVRKDQKSLKCQDFGEPEKKTVASWLQTKDIPQDGLEGRSHGTYLGWQLHVGLCAAGGASGNRDKNNDGGANGNGEKNNGACGTKDQARVKQTLTTLSKKRISFAVCHPFVFGNEVWRD